MFEQIKKLPGKALHVFRTEHADDARASLQHVERELA